MRESIFELLEQLKKGIEHQDIQEIKNISRAMEEILKSEYSNQEENVGNMWEGENLFSH